MNHMNEMVVGMGEALWDVLPEGKKIGGAPANFAYHVSQFGLPSRVVSAVGEDKLGTEILDNFREKKLNCMIEQVPYPTGTVQVELDAEGVPILKRVWLGTIFLIPMRWRGWLIVPGRSVSVPWRSVASYHVKPSTVFWMPCLLPMKH